MDAAESNVVSFFNRLGATVARIPTEHRRTPDLLVMVRGVEVVVEIKSINENPEEKQAIRAIEAGKVVSLDHFRDRDRFASKIKDANNQLKQRCLGKPGLVVIADSRSFFTRTLTSQQVLLEAMFGVETLWLTMPNALHSASSHLVAHEFGLGRTLAPDANTTSSAVALFTQHGEGDASFLIHHNPHAAVPLARGLFQWPTVREFIVESTTQFTGFVEVGKNGA